MKEDTLTIKEVLQQQYRISVASRTNAPYRTTPEVVDSRKRIICRQIRTLMDAANSYGITAAEITDYILIQGVQELNYIALKDGNPIIC